MKFNVVTIFPEMINAYIGSSIIKRAIRSGLITVDVYNLRDFSGNKHNTVDDYPYGGGAGMVMKPEPFFRIAESLWPNKENRKIIFLSPTGRVFDQDLALELYCEKREIVFFCGRYEAIDARVRDCLADDEISIGDYVLTGGELPALVIIDAVARLVPGVLGDLQSLEQESFSRGLLEHPHYTRPEEYRGISVPRVLLSGNHGEIERWRRKQALKLTLEKRPDLFEKFSASSSDRKLLDEIKKEESQ